MWYRKYWRAACLHLCCLLRCLMVYFVSLFVIFAVAKQERYWEISKHSIMISILVVLFYFALNAGVGRGENLCVSGIILLIAFSILKGASRNLLKNLLRICKKNPRGMFTLLSETTNNLGATEYWGVVEINGKDRKSVV